MNVNGLIAIIFGLISTVLLHLGKAMERRGIGGFNRKKPEESKKDDVPASTASIYEENVDSKSKMRRIYYIGMAFNLSVPLWATLANAYADPSYFVSVFGIGLIILMLYSHHYLGEEIIKEQIIGAVILVVGTLIIGYDKINADEVLMSNINENTIGLILVVYIIILVISFYSAIKSAKPLIVGIVFGLFAGGFGGMDVLFKGMGQNRSSDGNIFPTDAMGWVIYLASFGVGTMAMLITQWGFAKKADASVLVPTYNTMYIVLPMIMQLIALPGFTISALSWLGIIMIVFGIIFMQAHKSRKEQDGSIKVVENTEENA